MVGEVLEKVKCERERVFETENVAVEAAERSKSTLETNVVASTARKEEADKHAEARKLVLAEAHKLMVDKREALEAAKKEQEQGDALLQVILAEKAEYEAGINEQFAAIKT